MKKKKPNSASLSPDLDLKSLIHQHSQFFDNLVELIPARFYLPVDENEKPWFQGLSKVAKASAKKESRENIKKARRARLDPEKASTTLDLLQKNIDDVKKKEEDSALEVEFEVADTKVMENKSVTYEELREKLHKRIEELRLKRNAAESDKPKNERNEKRREIREGKRKRYEEEQEEKVKEAEKLQKIEEDVEKATERLAFSHVKIGSEDELGRKKKKKKLSKLQALEEAKKLQEVKKDPEQGKKLSWRAAQDRAAGVKVHDDPRLIKESIRKGKKKHEKNVEKWKERLESRDKVRAEKQQKRSGNIAERIHDKKMRKIAKREKKLMRPGFEGRKEEKFVLDIYRLGARKISLVGLPPIGCLPLIRSINGGACREDCNNLARRFDGKLKGLVAKLSKELNGIKLLFTDVFTPALYIINNPQSFDGL